MTEPTDQLRARVVSDQLDALALIEATIRGDGATFEQVLATTDASPLALIMSLTQVTSSMVRGLADPDVLIAVTRRVILRHNAGAPLDDGGAE